MLKSISYWSMPGGLEGRCEIKDAFKLAKNAGFQALEFAIGLEGLLTPETDKAPAWNTRRLPRTPAWLPRPWPAASAGRSHPVMRTRLCAPGP